MNGTLSRNALDARRAGNLPLPPSYKGMTDMNQIIFLAVLICAVVLFISLAERIASRLVFGPKAKAVPQVGELWLFNGTPNDGPWERKSYTPVRVLDIRDGWVRYDLFDSRMKLDSFVRMYRPAEAKPSVDGLCELAKARERAYLHWRTGRGEDPSDALFDAYQESKLALRAYATALSRPSDTLNLARDDLLRAAAYVGATNDSPSEESSIAAAEGDRIAGVLRKLAGQP
jgi:hypothetical protein